jgi:hypothetical protein
MMLQFAGQLERRALRYNSINLGWYPAKIIDAIT